MKKLLAEIIIIVFVLAQSTILNAGVTMCICTGTCYCYGGTKELDNVFIGIAGVECDDMLSLCDAYCNVSGLSGAKDAEGSCHEATTSSTTSILVTTTTTSVPTTSSTTSTSSTTTTMIIETTTTTTEEQPCPIEQIYGEDSKEVKILIYIRDNMLSQSSEGQDIIKLY